ncbi:exopolygalacturonase [Rufibacter radiotolerans]|uniref:Exopolygalacturonase n=1 Tax=Rufibacter radiotolerans TaxID=1379910 RepID=A0A0H4VQ03_9BACT|nr:glycosyl hydrolase family 28 protein [Rufibacter radiotolerans]AKQ46012.1 exopolygalacturonase [Rufibacter radiotolerans]
MKKFLLSLLFAATLVSSQAKDFVITKYGACKDSTKLNTLAIQKLIDKVHKKGGGTIVIPKGVFLSGALFFKPKTNLRLLEGAVLKGSDDIAHYPLIPSRMEGQKLDYYAALVNAYQVNNFSITGPGTINGNGEKFWKQFWAYRDSLKKLNQVATNLDVHRPRLIFIWGSNNVTIKDVKIRNAGFWTTHLYQSNNVLIENCDIRSPYRPVPAPSTDGIDIDVCRNVIVRGCYISVNDDAIAIKGGKGPTAHTLPENGPVEDILIENCTFGETHSVLTLGSESIHAQKITMRNCRVDNNAPLLRMKMRPDTYQTFENITIENITGKCGSLVNMSPWKQFFDLGGSSEKPFGTIRNIIFSNLTIQCNNLGVLEGNSSDVVSGIVFRNSTIKAEKPTLKNAYPQVEMVNVTVNGTELVLNKN